MPDPHASLAAAAAASANAQAAIRQAAADMNEERANQPVPLPPQSPPTQSSQ